MLSKLCGINRRVQILVRLADKLDMQGEYAKADCIDELLIKYAKLVVALDSQDKKNYETFKSRMTKNDVFDPQTSNYDRKFLVDLLQFSRDLAWYSEKRGESKSRDVANPSKEHMKEENRNQANTYNATRKSADKLSICIEHFINVPHPTDAQWNEVQKVFQRFDSNIFSILRIEKIQ